MNRFWKDPEELVFVEPQELAVGGSDDRVLVAQSIAQLVVSKKVHSLQDQALL